MSGNRALPVPIGEAALRARITDAVLDVAGSVPSTRQARRADPATHARTIASAAAAKAAVASGGLALPPGWLGWFTVLPEMVGIWKLQAQMVADIAGVYGQDASLTREHMLYCLFRHTAAQALRDLVVRAGQRYVVRQASLRVMRGVAGTIGGRLMRSTAMRGTARWLPVVGAVGVAGYAYYDTAAVARTAIELFESGIAEAQSGGSPD